MPIKLASLYF